ncbi:LysR family transcriptional regulator, partial [Streptomyces lasiicapitis]
LAARGRGVAGVPAPGSSESADASGLRVGGCDEQGQRGRLGLAWRTDGPAGPAARAFLARLRAALTASARVEPEPARISTPVPNQREHEGS